MVQRLRFWSSIATAAALFAAGTFAASPAPAAAATSAAPSAAPPPAAAAPTPALVAAPSVSVSTVVSGLSHPWDLTWVNGLLLYDLRSGQVWSKNGSAAPQRVTIAGFPSIYAVGEGGLLGMVADPSSATNLTFYTCQAVRSSTGAALDVRVLRWRLTSNTTAVSAGSPVVTGIPLSSGRHSGCRLRFGTDGLLYVGTGDAAVGTNPQNLASLGGKVLRVGRDGTIPTDNPFYSRGGNARYVWGYGHRNIQGLAVRPGTSELWSAEHGTDRDDEINLGVRGANYGWDPVPGYDESTPMTDLSKFPSAIRPMWSTGYPTVAMSGATFLSGPGWGEWQGALAVGLLKGEGIYLMRFNPSLSPSRAASVVRLPAAQGYGRIRAVQLGPDRSLYFTTSNGSSDRIVRIAPSSTAVPQIGRGSLVTPSGVTAARTGTQVLAFVRSTADGVWFKRSTDDARSWSGWLSAGVATTAAPSAASSSAGRVDLFTTNASRQVVHTWFVNGVRAGSVNLGGTVISVHGASLGNGTLDVFAVTPDSSGWRKRFSGGAWSAWSRIDGTFTSALSASADPVTGSLLVTGRGLNGVSYERVFTTAGGLGSWAPRSDGMSGWSAKAFGDVWPGQTRVAVSVGPDRHATVQRGGLLIGLYAAYTAAPDVVTRSDGSFLMVGRGTDGHLYTFDTTDYANRNLGGIVR